MSNENHLFIYKQTETSTVPTISLDGTPPIFPIGISGGT